MYNRIIEITKQIQETNPEIKVSCDEKLSAHTSFRIGGRVAVMFFPETASQLAHIAGAFEENGIQPYILGNGTNILASDKDLPIPVIKTLQMCSLELTGPGEITAQCGATLSRTAMFAMEKGLAGLSFAHGIPGTVGGAVVMNAGAYGGEIRDVLVSTRVYSKGKIYTVTGADNDLSYRHSRFTDSGEIVLEAVFRLEPGDPEKIREEIRDLAERRRKSQPLDQRSAGSTFKRPATGYAAAMIEQAGLKGLTVGGAQVSEKHAGFVINRGGATCEDVRELMRQVQQAVREKFGTELEPEVKLWSL